MQPKDHHDAKKDAPLTQVYVETMKHFDDIPIAKIQKMTGYQTHPVDFENERQNMQGEPTAQED